jgi:K+ transporter
VILSIETPAVPHVPAADRVVIDDLGYTDDGITHASARLGYMDQPNVPEVLRQIEEADIESPIEVDDASYFLSTIDLCRGDAPGRSRWRKTCSPPRKGPVLVPRLRACQVDTREEPSGPRPRAWPRLSRRP